MTNLRWILYICILFQISCSSDSNINKTNSYDRELTKAIGYLEEFKIDSAEYHLTQIIQNINSTTQPDIYIRAELNLGKINGDRGDNVTALKHYQNALRVAENSNSLKIIPHIEKNIGVLYVQWKKFDEALEYYTRAENSAQDVGDKELIADLQNNKGIIYEQQENFTKAIELYKEALSYYLKVDKAEKIAMTYSNLASVYKLQGKYEESIHYNIKSLELLETTQDKWSIAATLNNIGNLYGEKGDYEKAKYYCEKSLDIAQSINAEEIIGMAYESLANAAANVGDYKNAFAYYQNYSKSQNAFINTENTLQLTELSIKYETEKKEKLIAEAKVKSKQKNMWLILLGAGLIVVFILFRNYREKVKYATQQLALENRLLKEQTIVKVQEQRLEISRDLHDSLGAQLTLINSGLDGLKNQVKQSDSFVYQKIEQIYNYSENSISELRNTLWALHSKDLSLKDLKFKILNYVSQASEVREDISFKTEIDVNEAIQIPSKPCIHIFRVTQELINNAIKYAEADEICLTMKEENKFILLQIFDNGKGFNLGDVKDNSYGISNIRNRIKEINGTLEINSKIGEGSMFEIKINMSAWLN